jgi:hypothetical protein
METRNQNLNARVEGIETSQEEIQQSLQQILTFLRTQGLQPARGTPNTGEGENTPGPAEINQTQPHQPTTTSTLQQSSFQQQPHPPTTTSTLQQSSFQQQPTLFQQPALQQPIDPEPITLEQLLLRQTEILASLQQAASRSANRRRLPRDSRTPELTLSNFFNDESLYSDKLFARDPKSFLSELRTWTRPKSTEFRDRDLSAIIETLPSIFSVLQHNDYDQDSLQHAQGILTPFMKAALLNLEYHRQKQRQKSNSEKEDSNKETQLTSPTDAHFAHLHTAAHLLAEWLLLVPLIWTDFSTNLTAIDALRAQLHLVLDLLVKDKQVRPNNILSY